MTHSHGFEARDTNDGGQSLTYRFNGGVPNLITSARAALTARSNVDHNLAVLQPGQSGAWRRLPSQPPWPALRLFRQQLSGAACGTEPMLAPARDHHVPRAEEHGVARPEPRLRLSCDPTGNGKTAVKVSLNRYLQSEAAGSPLAADPARLNALVTHDALVGRREVAARAEIAIREPAGQRRVRRDGEIRRSAAHGQAPVYDPDLLRGWDKRTANWEFSGGSSARGCSRAPRLTSRISAAQLPELRRHRQPCGERASDFRSVQHQRAIDRACPAAAAIRCLVCCDLQPAELRPAGGQLRHPREQLRQPDRTLAGCRREPQHAAAGGREAAGGVSTEPHA